MSDQRSAISRQRSAARASGLGVMIVLMAAALVQAAEVPDAVLKAEKDRIAAMKKATAASISVFARGGRGGGSGVVITPDGYALTNFHVASPAGKHMQCSMPDGKLYDAVIVSYDPTGDVAMIKLFGRDDFPCAEMADSDTVREGDWCFAVGNPFLLATDFQPTVTWGLVSGVHRYQEPAGTLLEYTDCIQTDASINPGNSGGPLFNAKGQLIGINGRGSFEKRGRVNVGVGYAISINQIKHFMGYLRSGRIVDHATLGATVTRDDEGSVVVSNILPESDAYRRGLRYNDEILAFGGRQIGTQNAFKNVLGIYPRGWRVPLTYRRDGKRYDVMVRLSGVHSREELIKKIQRRPPAMPGPKDRPKKPGPGDEPKDGEKPKDGKKPKLPDEIPIHRLMPKAKPMPKHVAKFYKERTGYANYYFNELNRNRVWNAFLAESDFTKSAGSWRLEGQIAEGGGTVEIVLGEKQVTGKFADRNPEIDLTKDLDAQTAPSGSGGLLAALHLWQRLLTSGPAKYGEVYYLGSAPMLGREELVDVLVATHDVVESRFMFDPASGRLLGMEFYPERDVDPCEVYFSEYREVDGRMVPHRLTVLFGDEVFGVIDLKKLTLPEGEKKDAT